MNAFPTLETEKFVLRRLQRKDAPDLFHYFSSDLYTKFDGMESLTKVEQAEDLIRIFDERFNNEKGLKWGITMNNEDRVIGTCGFENWKKSDFKAEIGYGLSPEHWNNGIMTEVLNEVIKYGFEKLGLNRIEAMVTPDNVGSKVLLEKCGFKEEGYLRDYFFEKSSFVDIVIYSLLKKEFNGK